MRGKWFLIATLGVVTSGGAYYRREKVRASTDYSDPLRYDRMSWVGIPVDYRKEPLVAWKIVDGRKRLELTGGGPVMTCMDEHLLLGDRFEGAQPANLGEAVDRCRTSHSK